VPIGCSLGESGNRHGEGHDEISTDLRSGSLIASRNYIRRRSKSHYGYSHYTRYYGYYPVYPTVPGYWDYYQTSAPGRGNDEESTR
jgi:hypothetical protein